MHARKELPQPDSNVIVENLVQNSVQLIFEEGFRRYAPTSLDARRGALAN